MATATSAAEVTQVAASGEPAPVPAGEPALYRMSLATYARLGELGVLTRADRVVLLDGLLVHTMTKGPIHSSGTLRAARLLGKYLPPGYLVRPELPIELPHGIDGDSAPEPDVSLVRGDIADYDLRHPGATDIVLVVEVADSSLRLDRIGLRRYAWAGIPAVWIVNLRGTMVEIYTEPTGPSEHAGYATKTTRQVGEMLTLALDGGVVIAGMPVRDLFR